MKIGLKKFWILWNHEERIEMLEEKDYDTVVGGIHAGHFAEGISMVSGWYIIVPEDEDICEYKRKLILYLMERENRKIKSANIEIGSFLEKLKDIETLKSEE